MSQPDHLILEMQKGNEKAFAKIYEMYSNAIYSVIFVIVRSEELAEEIVQDVFVKVWKNASSYSLDKGRFYTWLLNIARNAAIDKTRSKAFKNSTKNLSPESFDTVLSSHDNLQQSTNTIGIEKLVAQLKPMCIKLLDFLYFKGYTQSEVAETMATPIGTIKTHTRMCIQKLRDLTMNERL